MRFMCPNCKQLMREFEPTQREREIFFNEEELVVNEVVNTKPCSTCLTRTDI